MGIKVSEGKIEASGKIGGRAAEGSIDNEAVIEFGIDFKVGGLGITSDYGGAIVVTIAGQSITWGREGGLIEYNFAGFQVTVEARDCVVTETKKIAGIVVAEHTYPDPGCKLPEPPEPVEPYVPPEDPSNPTSLEIPNSEDLMYVFIRRKSELFYGNLGVVSTGIEFGKATNIVEGEIKPYERLLPFDLKVSFLSTDSQGQTLTEDVSINKGTACTFQSATVGHYDPIAQQYLCRGSTQTPAVNNPKPISQRAMSPAVIGAGCYGTGASIKSFLDCAKMR